MQLFLTVMYLFYLTFIKTDGNIPRDSTYVIYEELSVPVWLYVTMTSCSGIGILAAIGFFLFNIIHRDNR